MTLPILAMLSLPGGGELILLLLLLLIGGGTAVPWFLAIAAAFRKETSPLLGVLMVVFGLFFPPAAIILGWVNVEKWGIRRTMIWWTAATVLTLILFFAVVALSA